LQSNTVKGIAFDSPPPRNTARASWPPAGVALAHVMPFRPRAPGRMARRLKLSRCGEFGDRSNGARARGLAWPWLLRVCAWAQRLKTRNRQDELVFLLKSFGAFTVFGPAPTLPRRRAAGPAVAEARRPSSAWSFSHQRFPGPGRQGPSRSKRRDGRFRPSEVDQLHADKSASGNPSCARSAGPSASGVSAMSARPMGPRSHARYRPACSLSCRGRKTRRCRLRCS
jgi:hypothetical protein